MSDNIIWGDIDIDEGNEKFRKIAEYVNNSGENDELYLETNFDEMSLEELIDFREKLEEVTDNFHSAEPDIDEESEKHAAWEEMLLDLEELIDEVEDRIETLEEE